MLHKHRLAHPTVAMDRDRRGVGFCLFCVEAGEQVEVDEPDPMAEEFAPIYAMLSPPHPAVLGPQRYFSVPSIESIVDRTVSDPWRIGQRPSLSAPVQVAPDEKVIVVRTLMQLRAGEAQASRRDAYLRFRSLATVVRTTASRSAANMRRWATSATTSVHHRCTDRIWRVARGKNLTLREIALETLRSAFVGTPDTNADELTRW
ncbi:hypothetical protein NKI31_31485 [Mesorhizobium sp. M0659]|uniref:hypothetical protein n=1 Tax=Mesorhizobium sp. M0659 TaxID=2956980 RepID=UPI003338FC45